VEHWQDKRLATIETTTNLLVMIKKLVGYGLVAIQTHSWQNFIGNQNFGSQPNKNKGYVWFVPYRIGLPIF
jgi:hypothetical protein